jgi:hypothetical protein
VSQLGEPLGDCRFVSKSCVIGSDCNSHIVCLRQKVCRPAVGCPTDVNVCG